MNGLQSWKLYFEKESGHLKTLSGKMSEMRKSVLQEVESKITVNA